MVDQKAHYVQVAVPSPLRSLFDYLPPEGIPDTDISAGQRVEVPFGKRRVIGIITGVSSTTEIPGKRLKKITRLIDRKPIFNQQHIRFFCWASEYYQHPIGEVLLNSLPVLLKQGKEDRINSTRIWLLSEAGRNSADDALSRAPRQQNLLNLLRQHPDGLSREEIENTGGFSDSAIKGLLDKGYIVQTSRQPLSDVRTNSPANIKLSDEQRKAVTAIRESLQTYRAFLLNGVTGSGKTEIYIQIIHQVLEQDQQALVLLPEIALTPQFIKRLENGIQETIAVYHSGMTPRERLNTWLNARDGHVRVILGTRSAIWLPLQRPGLFIVDEEHDLSYKQQDGFRYSARDLALVRGKNNQCPVILGSATPSLESFHNLAHKDYHEIGLQERVADASMPTIQVLDMKTEHMNGAISDTLEKQIKTTLQNNQQVLIFQNRRGYAPAFMCHGCGWLAECDRCNKLMTLHKQKQRLWCHHCDKQKPIPKTCPDCCETQMIEVGHGTERIEETLKATFPAANIIRIDRDTTRNRDSMNNMYQDILSGHADILIGTQMLAKGHHFPNVTLAALVDVDSSLYSTDFRATERLGQLITQVSGRAGRGKHPGTVMIQTHYPDHPLLKTLLNNSYRSFAESLLIERNEAGLPPYTFMAILRSEANSLDNVEAFLSAAKSTAKTITPTPTVIGPIMAPMMRKAGRYRMQLLLQTTSRQTLNRFLSKWLSRVEGLKQTRKVRWSIDVDPQDMM